VSADAVFGLARHLTGRDREIVLRLYDQQVLTTDQLELLFFSSRRRCQDRLLFLYRHRVVDRFYRPSPFGAGKPQAHWLLDEAGEIRPTYRVIDPSVCAPTSSVGASRTRTGDLLGAIQGTRQVNV